MKKDRSIHFSELEIGPRPSGCPINVRQRSIVNRKSPSSRGDRNGTPVICWKERGSEGERWKEKGSKGERWKERGSEQQLHSM